MLERTDLLDPAKSPFGKPTSRLSTPNIFDLIVIEDVPISAETFRRLPYKSPHPDYANNGLVLVWQGPVKAANNQIVTRRVYALESEVPENWYNYAIKYSGDAVGYPIYVRSYTVLREGYTAQARGTTLSAVMLLRVTNRGSGYTSAPTVAITGGGGSGATANAIMVDDKVIGLQITAEGTGYTSNPTVAFSGGGGTGAAASALIQPIGAVLVKEETAKLDTEDQQLSSLFIRVHQVYEVLPGPWVPFTRYDDDLGPVQGRRRAVLADDTQKASLSAVTKRTYEGRDGSAIVSMEIEETWTTGEGSGDNPAFPIRIWDQYRDERGAVDRTTQLVPIAGNEETQEATLTRSGGVVTKIDYEAYNEFLLRKVEEHWVEVIINDQRVTSEHGGGILDITERTDEPGAQTPDTGFLIVDSQLKTKSPHEQTKTTSKLSPDSAQPVLELTAGGSSYTTAPTVGFSGGTGTGAAATAVLGKAVESVTVTNGGSGYASPPVVGFISSNGGGAFAVAVLGFGLDSIAVLDGGSGYTAAPTVGITGDGTGAAATAILGKGVASIAVTSPGSGFTGAPAVVFTGDGEGAAANVIMGHVLAELLLDTPGTGYTTAPTVGFSGGSGTGAAATALLGKAVASAAVTAAGTGYTQPPELSVVGDGIDASIVARLGVVGTPAVVSGGTGYVVGDVLTVLDGAGTSIIAAQLLVSAVSGGVITAVTIQTVGVYSDRPANAAGVSGGTGTGATFTLAWGVSRLDVLVGGSGYSTPPTITITVAHGGTGSTFTTTLAASGVIKSLTLTNPGTGYLTAPTVAITGGGGTGGTAHVTIDEASLSISSIEVIAAGSGYTTAPTLSFVGGDGTGAAATASLASSGSVKSVNVTTPGTGYTVAPTISFSGGSGTGASASSNLAVTGSVKSVTVANGGLFESTPTLSFSGGGGTSAAGTAVLASAGQVKRLVLTSPGLYTVEPTVAFSGGAGSGAAAIYHIGDALWPTLLGHHTDPTEGIVINLLKTVIPAGTLHPGRGNYVDDEPYDRWKTIRIVSAVDLSTLPLPEIYSTLFNFHLPPTLLSVEGVWSDVGSKLADAQASSAHVAVSSGSAGGIIVRRSGGFHGYANATVERIFFFGPPPATAIPPIFRIITASGSIVITSKRSSTHYTNQLDGGTSIGDDDSVTNHAMDINDHIVGAFSILNATHQSPPRSAVAESGEDTSTDPPGPPVVAAVSAYGQLSTMTVQIPRSFPSIVIPGQVVLAAAHPEKWRFGVWVLELIRVTLPSTSL